MGSQTYATTRQKAVSAPPPTVSNPWPGFAGGLWGVSFSLPSQARGSLPPWSSIRNSGCSHPSSSTRLCLPPSSPLWPSFAHLCGQLSFPRPTCHGCGHPSLPLFPLAWLAPAAVFKGNLLMPQENYWSLAPPSEILDPDAFRTQNLVSFRKVRPCVYTVGYILSLAEWEQERTDLSSAKRMNIQWSGIKKNYKYSPASSGPVRLPNKFGTSIFKSNTKQNLWVFRA